MIALLSISRAGFSIERRLLDITQAIMNVKYVLLEDNDYKRNAKLELELSSNVYSEVIELEFIMTLENIFRNAIEAIMETKQYGWIHVLLDHEKLEITNNGGAIKTCTDCALSCLECKKFSKIGYTTKERGSGNGIPQIIQFARSSGWDIKIKGYDDKTSITLLHKKVKT
jgi:sensor histidine kinase regulating citrate/malate metabolism